MEKTRGITQHSTRSSSAQQPDATCCDTYLHGTLSTAGIVGASPMRHSLTKHAHLLLDAASLAGQPMPQAATCSSYHKHVNDAAEVLCGDPGMRPKVWIPRHTNRPDLTHSTADIEGAQPRPKDICHHPRDTNPLTPSYMLPGGSGLQLPSGPLPPARQPRDILSTADIAGATARPSSPAARAAVARVAAGGCCTAASSTRPGVLVVADIDGASTAWRQQHRRQTGTRTRDTALDVADINSYMAAFKPGPRDSCVYKGHPQGPRVPSPIKPRGSPAMVDNSLRLFDIEGSSMGLATKRAPHPSPTLTTGDIEGAQAGARDKQQAFLGRRAAAVQACTQQQAAQVVLAGLQLGQTELQLLWRECSRLDRDRSGFLTVLELQQALSHAQLQLAPLDMQALLTALKNNANLVDYKKLTRTLKGQVSRPASANAAAAAAAAAAVNAQSAQGGMPAQPAPTRPASASAAGGRLGQQQQQQQAGAVLAPEAGCARQQAVLAPGPGSCNASVRPRTAPAASRSAGHGDSGRASANVSISRATMLQSSRGASGVSYWFGGSARDTCAADDMAHWLPGRDVKLLHCIASSTVHHDEHHHQQQQHHQQAVPLQLQPAVAAAGQQQQQEEAGEGQQQQAAEVSSVDGAGGGFGGNAAAAATADVVPGWLIGADAVAGTFRVHQPFGTAWLSQGHTAATCAASPCHYVADSRPEQLQAAVPSRPRTAVAKQRPASACCVSRRPMSAAAGASCNSSGPDRQQQQQLARPASAQPRWHGSWKQQQRQGSSGGRIMSVCGSSCKPGLAEMRRLIEADKQDLLAVRMLA